MQVVLRVRLETGVADFEAVRFKEGSDAHGICLLLLHTHAESLDTAKQQPRVKGRESTSGSIDGKEEAVAQRRVIDGDDTSHEVVVAGEVLGARLVDDIGAEVERVQQHGRHHGVVYCNNGRGVCGVGDAGDGGNIADLDQRVRRRFQEHHGRLVVDDFAHLFGVRRVDVMYYDAAVCREILEQSVCSAVQVVASDYFVTGSQETRDDVQRAHARRHDECAVRVHDLGKMSLEVCPRGIARACVVILAAAAPRLLLEGGSLRALVAMHTSHGCRRATPGLPGRWERSWHCTGRCSRCTPAPS